MVISRGTLGGGQGEVRIQVEIDSKEATGIQLTEILFHLFFPGIGKEVPRAQRGPPENGKSLLISPI